MKPRVLSVAQSRAVDRIAIDRFGIPGLTLMENAGRGVAEWLMRQLEPESKVLIVCGRGNNAGDGFVIARYLHQFGHRACVFVLGDPAELRGDALTNWDRWRALGRPGAQGTPVDLERYLDSIEDPAWVVDALLGTGARGAPRPPFAEVIDRLNRLDAKRLAIDVPSGLDADTGAPSSTTFRADVTCTFVSAKPGLLAPAAQPLVGQLVVIDLGIPEEVIELAAGGNYDSGVP